MVASFAGAVFFYGLASKVNKEHVLMLSTLAIMFVSLLKWFAYTPTMPYLALTTTPFIAFAGSIFWIAFPSMKADACDWGEFKSGKRQEGIICGVVSWCAKAATSIGLLLSGVLLWLSGFDAELKGDQTDSTILIMRALFVVTPFVINGIILYLIVNYPLSKKALLGVRTKLEQRRGIITTTPATAE